MLARLLQLHPKTYGRLVRLSKEAERDGAYRVAKRLQAVVLNSEGRHERGVGGDSEGAKVQGVGVAIPLSKTRGRWVT